MSTYVEKIDQAKAIISEHNGSADKKIDLEQFVKDLKNSGGTTDKALELCQWEDLEKIGVPRLLAKQMVKVFRVAEDKNRPNRIITEARCQAMSAVDLLEAYDVRNHDNMVGKRLRELSGGKRCLVFGTNGELLIAASRQNIDELREGYGEREVVIVDGCPFQTFRIGEHPDQYAHLNPLFTDCLLRPDETCDHTNRSWKGITDEVRIILYIAKKQTRELRIESVDDAHNVLDFLEKNKTDKAIRSRYSKAAVIHDQLKKEGTLPSLRKRKGQPQGQSNDPFFAHKKF